MTDDGRQPDRSRPVGSKLLNSFLDSPLSGLAPWIVLAVLAGQGRYEAAIAIAFVLSLVMLWLAHRRGDRMHSLTVFGTAFFGVLLVVRVAMGVRVDDWLTTWTGAMSNIALTVFTVSGLLLRKPFTLSYARESTPEELWDTPAFMRTNYVISAVWAAAFAFSAVLSLIGILVLHDPDNFWTGWILSLGGIFFAIAFTNIYPDYVGAKLEREAGTSRAPLPSLLPLVDWIPMYAAIVGVIGLAIDAMPTWLGVTFIVAGAIGSLAVRHFSKTANASPPSA